MYSTRTVHGFFLYLVSVLSVICALNVPLVDDFTVLSVFACYQINIAFH